MPEFNRLRYCAEWIDLECPGRERTPRSAIQLSIQLHLADLSFSNTRQHLERLGVERGRAAIHDWVRTAGLQPDSDVDTDRIGVDETMIRVSRQRHWLLVVVDPDTDQLRHFRLFQTRTTQLTVLSLRELRERQQVSDVTFLVDDAHHLEKALGRLGLRFRYERHGSRNGVEHILCEVKRRTSSFSNTFSHA